MAVLGDPKKRSEVIKTLEAVAKALPRPTPAVNSPIHLKPNSLGAALIAQISTGLHQLRQEAQSAIGTAAAIRPMWLWLSSSARDSTALRSLSYTIGKVLLVLSGALIVEWLTGRALRSSLAAVESHARRDIAGDGKGAESAGRNSPPSPPRAGSSTNNGTLLRHLPFAIGHVLLELVAVMAFAVTQL